MVLTVNIENTIITFGVFDDDRLSFSASIAASPNATEFEYAASFQQILTLSHIPLIKIDGIILASVVPMLTPKLKQACRLLFHTEPLLVSAGVKTGLNLKVSTATLGTDFVCAAACAVREYKTPSVIVSLGTATTFSAIDGNGVFCGTAIAAGVQVSLEALHQCAAQLPQASIEPPQAVIGTNTAASMRSGLIYGTASMIDGMCARFAAQLSGLPVFLATGQHAQDIIPYCDTPFVSDPHLVLKGLYYIYLKNKKQ